MPPSSFCASARPCAAASSYCLRLSAAAASARARCAWRFSWVATDSPDEVLKPWAQDRVAAVKTQLKRQAQRALAEAAAALKRKQYEEAAAQGRALAQSGDGGIRAQGLLLAGEAELKLGRYPAAIEVFEAAATVPGVETALQFRALAGVGTAYEEQQQWDEALKRYEEIATASPDAAQKRWARERAAAVKARQAPPRKSLEKKPAPKS